MRKALIGLIMAATVLTPLAAQAQERGERRNRYVQQEDSVSRPARTERREARQEVRQQRQEVRQQRQAAREQRQQQQVVVQQQQQQQQVQRVPGWGGSRSDPRMREHRERYDRLARENARRHGSEQQYREVVAAQRQANREARQDGRQDRRDDRRDWRQDRRDDRRDWRQDRRGDRRDWRQDRRQDRRDWNRDWRRDNRYNWQDWRHRNRNIFRSSRYYAPYRNHRYSRFSIGLILGAPFYSQRYWLSDPWQYRLPPAPYGTQWVRYYGDVLLVDVYTGEVIDVIYDFFW